MTLNIEQALHDCLVQQFPNASIRITGADRKYAIQVIDSQFQAQSKVKRQQSIYACINTFIASGELHAVDLQAFTPDEVEK